MSSGSILITQGEFAVSDRPGTFISTLLGSCVACCLWDDVAGVGGMNHLLLAQRKTTNGLDYVLAGATEMERLINDILKLGGHRSNLKAKVFGGASLLQGSQKVGADNFAFVVEYLAQEGIPLVKHSVGGEAALLVRFWPHDGRAVIKRNSAARVQTVKPALPSDPTSVELF